jgi:hypothetical protein
MALWQTEGRRPEHKGGQIVFLQMKFFPRLKIFALTEAGGGGSQHKRGQIVSLVAIFFP